MEMTTLIIVGVIVLIAIITIIGILSRYRKCKSDELLVVYGKTGSHKEKVNELDAKGNQVSREVEIKTASFMAKTAENLNPAFELLKSIPFKKTFKEMFVEDKKDNPTEDNFEAVK